MMTFNLKKFVIEAAGTQWGIHRTDPTRNGGEYYWWLLDDVIAGQNRSWNQWVNTNPSLRNVASECNAFQIRMLRRLERRYNLPAAQVKQFFKVYIGYNPSFGAYMCSIGPYIGDKPADEHNRFSFFTKRYQRADQNTVEASFAKYVDEKLSMFKDVVTPADFQMNLAVADTVDPETGNKTFRYTNVPDMTGQSAQMLMHNAPLQGQLTEYGLNSRGKAKIMRASIQKFGLQEQFNNAVAMVAREENKTPEQIQQDIDTGAMSTARGYGRAANTEITIADRVGEKMECFFPYIIRSQAEQGGWQDVLDRAIGMVAERSHLTPEQVWSALSTRMTRNQAGQMTIAETVANRQKETLRLQLTQQVTKSVNEIKKNMLRDAKIKPRSDDEATQQQKAHMQEIADRISFLPSLQELGMKGSGQQIPLALDQKTIQKSMLKLKKEILEKFVASSPDDTTPLNVHDIAVSMSASRAGKKTRSLGHEWTDDDIQYWVDQINEERQEVPEGQPPKTYAQILDETNREIGEMDDPVYGGSFKDFDTTCRMASLYFAESTYEQIDPVTRAVKKISVRHAPAIFSRDPEEPNYSSADLTALRQGQDTGGSTQGTGGAAAEEVDLGVVRQTPQPQEAVPQETTPSVPPSTPEATETQPEVEEELDPAVAPPPRPIRKIFKNTLQTLIKMSSELKQQGKYTASEEINKIVRKYMDI